MTGRKVYNVSAPIAALIDAADEAEAIRRFRLLLDHIDADALEPPNAFESEPVDR